MSAAPNESHEDEEQGEITVRYSSESKRVEGLPAGGSGNSPQNGSSPGGGSPGKSGRESLEDTNRLYNYSAKEEEMLVAQELSPGLQRLSVMCHLGIFAIMGVLVRFYCEILFGPKLGKVTADGQVAFEDLPANILGSFLMGMMGITLKPYVLYYSANLSLGFTTGLMGSITTYASWNQRMLTMVASSLWVRAICGYFVGMAGAQLALVTGADFGSAIVWFGGWVSRFSSRWGYSLFSKAPMRDNIRRKRWSLAIVVIIFAGILWPTAAVGAMLDKPQTSRRHVWLGCLVGPFGVWTRWYLSSLNGQGFGPKRRLAWFPVGTYMANILASLIEAALSVVLLSVNTREAKLLIGSFQLGVLGCLSTVSTFVLEAHTLHQSGKVWRTYKYVLFTMATSFLGGVLLYAVPVWALGYNSKYNHLSQL